ncbi:MAG: hypothetical protein WAN42_00110, partial [Pseudolabrys sp.]
QGVRFAATVHRVVAVTGTEIVEGNRFVNRCSAVHYYFLVFDVKKTQPFQAAPFGKLPATY